MHIDQLISIVLSKFISVYVLLYTCDFAYNDYRTISTYITYIIYIKYDLRLFYCFMDKIKKEGLSASFYEEVIDLTIEFFFRK